jgi:hypothetical protein
MAESHLSPSRRMLIAAAEECLPYLRERVERNCTSTMLLRPADPPCIPADVVRTGVEKEK